MVLRPISSVGFEFTSVPFREITIFVFSVHLHHYSLYNSTPQLTFGKSSTVCTAIAFFYDKFQRKLEIYSLVPTVMIMYIVLRRTMYAQG